MGKNIFCGFVLRNVAGIWTLLDLNHPEVSYKKTLGMNETGAFIYKKLDAGLTLSETASELSNDFGISFEEAFEDVKKFSESLKAFGVPLS